MKTISIKIPARWTQEDGSERTAKAVFKLGVGPCGKNVTKLVSYSGNHAFTVDQVHSDGTEKRFTYPWTTLTGRIEEEYA